MLVRVDHGVVQLTPDAGPRLESVLAFPSLHYRIGRAGPQRAWANGRPALLAILLSIVTAHAAQNPPDDPQPARQGADARQSEHMIYPEALRRSIASTLARQAVLRSRFAARPSRDDLRMTALGLQLAGRLYPDDEELIRLEREAWAAADSTQEVVRLNRALLRLNPRDTVAQLAVISDRIAGLQTVDDRLSIYDRLLSEQGAPLDPSVRSRLALDAALLARENGLEDIFLDRLTLATTLDVTNKQAAVLFASYFLERTDDPLERVELLCNVILADPFDRNALLNLSHELIQHGAFRGAQRLFALYDLISRRAGARLELDRIVDRVVITWNAAGPDAAIGYLSTIEAEARAVDEARRQEREAEGFDPGPRPAGYLVPQLEAIRLAIHVSRRDDARSRLAIEAMVEAAQRVLDASGELVGRQGDAGELPEEVKARYELENGLQLLWARLFSGQQIPAAQRQLDGLIEDSEALGQPLSPQAIARYRAWLDVHAGRTREAIEVLEPLAESDIHARWALAEAAELDGRTDDALAHYARVVIQSPATAVGTAARFRIGLIRGQQVRPTEIARELNSYVLAFAPWLDEAIIDPAASISLRVDYAQASIGLLAPIGLDVTITNRLDHPLAVGPDKPVRSQLLVRHSASVGAQRFEGFITPTLLRVGDRLRLRPREQITINTDLRREQLGEVFDRFPSGTANLRTRVIHRFQVDQTLSPVESPFAVFAQTPNLLVRAGIPMSITDSDLARELATSTSTLAIQYVALASSRLALIKTPAYLRNQLGADATQADLEAFVSQRRSLLRAALSNRLPRLGSLEQAYAIGRLHAAGEFDEVLAGVALTDSGLDLGSPYVLAALVLADVEPAYALAAESEDQLIARMGRAAIRAADRRAAQQQPAVP